MSAIRTRMERRSSAIARPRRHEGPGVLTSGPSRLTIPLFEQAAILVDVLLGDDGHRDIDAGLDRFTLLELQQGLHAGGAFLIGILLYDGDDPAFVDALDRLGRE